FAIYVSDSCRATVLVHQNIFRQRIGAQFEISALFRFRQEEPRGGEERAHVAALRTIGAVVASRMARMRDGKLRDAIRQIWDANLARPAFQNPVDAPEIHGRQIFAIGIAGAILHSARYADHALDTAVIRRDLCISNWPIHIESVASGSSKIDIAESGRRSPPKIRLPTNCK